MAFWEAKLPTAGARSACDAVRVSAPARLHLGFFDLNGNLGRRFGSLGITLDRPVTSVVATRAGRAAVTGPSARRADVFARKARELFGLPDPCRLEVEAAIPEHSGLGSGTQMALAAGLAACRLQDAEPAPREVAHLLDRGQRSGIGIGAFESGGVLLDGGSAAGEAPPPILARFDFPSAWRVILIFDRSFTGVHGPDEAEAFRKLPPFPADRAAHLCRVVLMRALPGIAEADLDTFGAAVAELQRAVGDHFAPVQGGRYASTDVAEVLTWFAGMGVTGVGQSSWGPTGFALLGSERAARALLESARERFAGRAGLEFMLCHGNNSGGRIQTRMNGNWRG
ncbi:MAG TPA: GHMP kinase [Halothiobacillaceae bacterium]|nr:GHMP kinase [Halothiobacillaceae bacterium]